MAKVKYRDTPMGSQVSTAVKILVGVPLIGATSTHIGALSAGTAKDIASIVPGLQSTALAGETLKSTKKYLK